MDKRFINFLMLSMLVMIGFMYLNRWLFPPQPPPDEQAQAEKEKDNEKDEGDEPQPKDDGDKPDGVGPGPDETPDPPANELTKRQTQPATWVALGSVDPTSDYRMLVTFSSRGATVARAELSSHKYRDLEDTAGYLGQLALTGSGDGLKVNVVGHGTPAAEAGLMPGDVILAVDETTLHGEEDRSLLAHFNSLLAESKPGDDLSLQVHRHVDGQPKTLALTATLTAPPLAVISPEHEDVFDPGTPLQPLSFQTTFSRVGQTSTLLHEGRYDREEIARLPSLHNEEWEYLDPSDDKLREQYDLQLEDEAAFRFELLPGDLEAINETGQLEVVKRYRLVKVQQDEAGNPDPVTGYHLTMRIEVRNLGEQTKQLGLQQMGATGLPLEGWWYQRKQGPHWGSSGLRDVIWRDIDSPYEIWRNAVITHHEDDGEWTPISVGEEMKYCVVDGLYFSAGLLPDHDAASYESEKFIYTSGEALPVGEIKKKNPVRSTTGITYRLVGKPFFLEAGQQYTQQYTVFIGPKDPPVLAEYGMKDTVSYGWDIFGVVAKVLLFFLKSIAYVVGNYGLAIFLLTVIVRLLMWPLGKKQAQNAEMMKKLAPELKAIQEKHKDLEARSKAQQELYRKHNFNPLGGCWMMFIQMPIFFGLYKALSVSIELRQAPLIPGLRWCSNLAAPDMLMKWTTLLGEGLAGEQGWLAFLTAKNGWLGPYFNILPLFTIVLFIAHQKLFTPPATDDQSRMQQKMMSYMMIFMGFLFFKVPSGLCLYFITSSLWGIAERKFLPKTKPEDETAPVSKKDLEAKSAKSDKSKTAEKKKTGEKGFVASLLEKLPQQPGQSKHSGNGIDDATRRKRRKKKKKR